MKQILKVLITILIVIFFSLDFDYITSCLVSHMSGATYEEELKEQNINERPNYNTHRKYFNRKVLVEK